MKLAITLLISVIVLSILFLIGNKNATTLNFNSNEANIIVDPAEEFFTPSPPNTNAEKTNMPLKNDGSNNPKKGILNREDLKGFIIEGRSIGEINIGDKKQKLLDYFGNPTEGYFYAKCNISDLHWNDIDLDNRGIFAYMKNDKIYQIESFTNRFRLNSEIKINDSPKDLISLYPDLEAYELLRSASIVDGSANLIFWVDNNKGIAFELYNYQGLAESTRKIASIIIFNPSEGFRPRGMCKELLYTRELIKRNKWFLDD